MARNKEAEQLLREGLYPSEIAERMSGSVKPVIGNPLIKALSDIYSDDCLHEQASTERRRHEKESEEVPHIVCSEALV